MKESALLSCLLSDEDHLITKILGYLKEKHYVNFLNYAKKFGLREYELKVDDIWYEAFYKLKFKAGEGIFESGNRKINPYFYTILKNDWIKLAKKNQRQEELDESRINTKNLQDQLISMLEKEYQESLLKIIYACAEGLSKTQKEVWDVWIKTPDHEWEDRVDFFLPPKSAASLRNIFKRAKDHIKSCVASKM